MGNCLSNDANDEEVEGVEPEIAPEIESPAPIQPDDITPPAEKMANSGPSSPFVDYTFTAETAEQFANWFCQRINALYENPDLNKESVTWEDLADIYMEDAQYHGEREVDHQWGKIGIVAVYSDVLKAFKSRKSEIEVTLFDENSVCFKEHVTFQTYEDKEAKITFHWKLTSLADCEGKVQEQTFGHGVSEEEKDASSKAYWDIIEACFFPPKD